MNLAARAFEVVWIAWGVIWLLAAFWSARTRVLQPTRDRLLNSVPVILGGILLFSSSSVDSAWGRVVLPLTPMVVWVGFGATVAGLLFAIWARCTLGRMWSGRVTLKEEHALVERGPYGLVRHPIYTGLVLALLGTALARDTALVWVGTLLVVAGLILKLKQEERLLESHFGPAYAEYRSRVKGLIPLIW
jgi:protein-S-isoprenylcysteine O-methyltransferase Ste14